SAFSRRFRRHSRSSRMAEADSVSGRSVGLPAAFPFVSSGMVSPLLAAPSVLLARAMPAAPETVAQFPNGVERHVLESPPMDRRQYQGVEERRRWLRRKSSGSILERPTPWW